MLKTNVDSILEMLSLDNPVALKYISKKLNIPEEITEKIARYLEEEEILKLEYKFAKPYAILLKSVNEIRPKQADIGMTKDDIEKFYELLDSANHDLNGKNFSSAYHSYKKLLPLYYKLPDSDAKKNIYERLTEIRDALVNYKKLKGK